MSEKEKYIQRQRRNIESSIDRMTVDETEEIYLDILRETAIHLWQKYQTAKNRLIIAEQ